MAQLGGLFAQLNQSILNHPLNEAFNFGDPNEGPQMMDTVNPLLRKVAQAGNAVVGGDPRSTMTGQEIAVAKRQQGREALAARARKIGMEALATEIEQGAGDLAEQAKALRDEEQRRFVLEQSWSAHKAALKGMGVDDETIESLKNADADAIKKVMDGYTGRIEGFTDAQGKQVALHVSKGGKVRDPKSGRYVFPSELGLRPEIKATKVIEAAKKFADKYIEGGVDRLWEFTAKAENAARSGNNYALAESLLNDGMIAGKFATAKLWLKEVALASGFPVNSKEVQDTQVFLASAGARIAEELKNYGAGTGLSDKDLEFARQVAGGDISMEPETLKRLMQLYRKRSEGVIEDYNKLRASTEQNLGENREYINMMPEITMKSVSEQRQDASGDAGPRKVRRYDPVTRKFEDVN